MRGRQACAATGCACAQAAQRQAVAAEAEAARARGERVRTPPLSGLPHSTAEALNIAAISSALLLSGRREKGT